MHKTDTAKKCNEKYENNFHNPDLANNVVAKNPADTIISKGVAGDSDVSFVI
jgi:hypothetical protein